MADTERAAQSERKRFEKWHTATFDEQPVWVPERNLYAEFGHHCAWKGWQASRAQEAPALTPAMIAAGRRALYEASHHDFNATDAEMQAAWLAMLAVVFKEPT